MSTATCTGVPCVGGRGARCISVHACIHSWLPTHIVLVWSMYAFVHGSQHIRSLFQPTSTSLFQPTPTSCGSPSSPPPELVLASTCTYTLREPLACSPPPELVLVSAYSYTLQGALAPPEFAPRLPFTHRGSRHETRRAQASAARKESRLSDWVS